MLNLFAVSSPGLEALTLAELQELGNYRPQHTTGGVKFSGDRETIYRANLHLRTANRVLVRLGHFYAAAFSELRKKAGRLPWELYLAPGQQVAFSVTCRKSRLYHSDAVAERVAGAIGDRLRQAPPLGKFNENADRQGVQLIMVRLVRDSCTISIDTSGALLHRRGYRLASAKAPLRETLAAGMLLASGWDQKSPLLDPFCGSGTIPIEAALLASGIAPGHGRDFAFMNWPGYQPEVWENLLIENRGNIRGDLPSIQASDRDAGAVEMARANAQRAGVAEAIDFSQRAISAIQPAQPGWIVTNPPYGRRASANKDLRNLYAQLGNILRKKCPGWQVAILCSDLQLLGQIRLNLETGLSLDNGGLAVRLALGEVAKA